MYQTYCIFHLKFPKNHFTSSSDLHQLSLGFGPTTERNMSESSENSEEYEVPVTRKVVDCPELCNPSDTWEVVCYTVEWQITEDCAISPAFRFGENNEHEAYITFYKYQSFDNNLNERDVHIIYFDFNTPTIELHSGILSLELGDPVFATCEPMRFGSMPSQQQTFTRLTTEHFEISCESPLKIRCEVKIKQRETTASINHRYKLIDDFAAFLANPSLTDFTIKVEGQKLQVHKVILAARCPVFAAMFQTDMAENRNNEISIEDISFKTMKELIHYIYTGTLPDLKESAEALLPAADKYGLDALRSECGDFLSRQVTPQNAARLLLLADRHHHGELRKKAVECTRKRKSEVVRTDDWKRIRLEDPQLLLDILTDQ